MKKVTVLALLICFAFCGCVKSDTDTFSAAAFKAQVSVKTQSDFFVFEADCKSADDITLTVLKPENIKGTVIKQGDKFSSKNTTGPAKELLCALKTLFEQSFTCPKEGISYIDASNEYGSFCVQIDFSQKKILTVKGQKYEYLFT